MSIDVLFRVSTIAFAVHLVVVGCILYRLWIIDRDRRI